MASTIIGTYPIIQNVSSSINQYGIQTISYIFTVKTEDANKYTPQVDSAYYGPNTTVGQAQYVSSDILLGKVKLLVTQATSSNLPGGLTQIVVNTSGPSVAEPSPKIMIVPNYPLIFGLASRSIVNFAPGNVGYGGGARGNGSPYRGLGVQMYFVTTIENEFEAYDLNQMPTTFRGIKLPTPAKAPFVSSGGTTPKNPPVVGGGEINSWTSTYWGFVKKEISMERIGGATLFRIIFAESGSYYTTYCPSVPAGQTVGSCETTMIYDF